MQVIDFSKKYEVPKGCGNHAEIFPKNIFSVIAGSTGIWQDQPHNQFTLARKLKSIIGTFTYTIPGCTNRRTYHLKSSYELGWREIIIKNKD